MSRPHSDTRQANLTKNRAIPRPAHNVPRMPGAIWLRVESFSMRDTPNEAGTTGEYQLSISQRCISIIIVSSVPQTHLVWSSPSPRLRPPPWAALPCPPASGGSRRAEGTLGRTGRREDRPRDLGLSGLLLPEIFMLRCCWEYYVRFLSWFGKLLACWLWSIHPGTRDHFTEIFAHK